MKDWRKHSDDGAEQRAWFELVPLLAIWLAGFVLTARWLVSLAS